MAVFPHRLETRTGDRAVVVGIELATRGTRDVFACFGYPAPRERDAFDLDELAIGIGLEYGVLLGAITGR